MEFSIDTLPNSKMIKEFALQYDNISMGFIKQCEEAFSGNESKEFYRGLITGYANAHNLLRQIDPNAKSVNSIGMIIAFISKKYIDLK